METRFRIGELSKKLCVEKFVIRFWEKEFNIKPKRSEGQQRFYTENDFKKFTAIKELLYHKGFTIAGAKKQLNTCTSKRAVLSATKTTLTEPANGTEYQKQLILLRQQLQKLQNFL
ncbi:MAG TPA: MerR family transcriptional regulator [Candidatus Dependentiae bacterium]|nr:MerR family transcriptional regulator [Candidatus Dependentiae bacterium]